MSFVHPNRPARTLGPFGALWIDGTSLRASPEGPILARHIGNRWEVDGSIYFRLDCVAPVDVRFEGPRSLQSRAFGPFRRFSAVEGLAYTDGRAFAFLDAKLRAWLCYDLGEHYPIMVVRQAPR